MHIFRATMGIVVVLGLAAGPAAAQSSAESPPNVPPSSLPSIDDEETGTSDNAGAASSEALDPDALIAHDLTQAFETAGLSTAIGAAVGAAVATAVIAVVLAGLAGTAALMLSPLIPRERPYQGLTLAEGVAGLSVQAALTLAFVASAGVSVGALIGGAAVNFSDGVVPAVVTSVAAVPGIIVSLSGSGVLTAALVFGVWWLVSGFGGTPPVPRYVYGAAALGLGAVGTAMALSGPWVAGAGAVAARTGLSMFSGLDASSDKVAAE